MSDTDIQSAFAAFDQARTPDQKFAALDEIAMYAGDSEWRSAGETAASRLYRALRPKETPEPIEETDMTDDAYGQATGSPESYIQAIMSAPNAAAKSEAMSRYEEFSKRQVSGGSAAPGSGGAASYPPLGDAAPPANIDAAIKEAFQRATQGDDGSIRAQGKADLARLYEQRATAGDGGVSNAGGAAVGFESPGSPGEYHFTATPGVDVQNPDGVGELKAALFSAGVPAPIANQAFANASRMIGQGVMATPEAHLGAVENCKSALVRTHGAEAASVIKDGAAYLNALADRDARLNEAVAVMLADPWAVTTAANLYRNRAGRVRR